VYPEEAIPDSPGGGRTEEHETIPVPVLPEMAQVKKSSSGTKNVMRNTIEISARLAGEYW